jgi:hypothetical protein
MLGHMATCHVKAPADAAFRYLADPKMLGRWSLGCWAADVCGEPGLYRGHSLIDGSPAWFRIEADAARRLIDFHVGAPDRLQRRIFIRIVSGEELERAALTCLVSMHAWRTAAMTDERWQRLRVLHEAEIILIGGQIEAFAANGSEPG